MLGPARFRFNQSHGLPLGERAKYVLTGRPSLDELLMRRLRDAGTADAHFQMPAARVYFRPPYDVADEAELLRGTLLILKEAYCMPGEFFDGPVRIRPGDTVLDLGGNLGTSAMTFAERTGPGGRVVSFEPMFHDLLRRNAGANGYGDRIEVVAAAVGEAAGEAEFAVTDAGVDSRLAIEGRAASHRVAVVSVDDTVAERGLNRVDFMKLDIEGAEEDALNGSRQTLARHRPKLTIASYHTDPHGRPQHPRLVAWLKDVGYQTRELFGDDGKGRHIYAWPA